MLDCDWSSDVCSSDLRSTEFEWGRADEWMLPGTDCLACHRPGGAARRVFTFAGTVTTHTTCADPEPNATVRIVDATGAELRLRTNEVGNFFSDQALEAPYHYYVERDGRSVEMVSRVVDGSCAACHNLDDRALGYVTLAGQGR
jgi:hypothetical protein